jgi:hypothetical protein
VIYVNCFAEIRETLAATPKPGDVNRVWSALQQDLVRSTGTSSIGDGKVQCSKRSENSQIKRS